MNTMKKLNGADITAATAEHTLPDGRVHLLGAVHQVTGAMTRVETGGKILLVDCGIAQGRARRDWVFPEAAKDSDCVILTHGHHDHIGSLPILLDSDWEKPIFATRATLDIAEVSLRDSMRMNDLRKHEINRIINRFKDLQIPIRYDKPAKALRDFPGTFAFRDAGHILGSASVEIVSEKSRVIVSGDLGRPNSPILEDFCTDWENTRDVDLVVMESTYGSRDHAHDYEGVEQNLERIIKETYARGGKVLVPSFAIGRTQVLLYFLNTLVEADRIPDLPVCIDTPMGLTITQTYNDFRKLFDKEALDKLAKGDDPLDFEDLYAVRKGRDSRKLMKKNEPMIIIAGSGMCTGGRIVNHLLDGGLEDPANTLMFVGYQAYGTTGRRIQEASERGEAVWIRGNEILPRCKIESLRGLSAHADRSELLHWLNAIPNKRKIALHHGDEDAQEAFIKYASGSGD
jgi:metallo-beta-lactamase family protein